MLLAVIINIPILIFSVCSSVISPRVVLVVLVILSVVVVSHTILVLTPLSLL
jgi:hypothetical protein